MLVKFKTIIFYSLLIITFISTSTFANNKYFKCPEKILKVIRGQDSLLKEGSILGINYIKFHINQSITIKFKYLGSKEEPLKIISDKKLIKQSLGYKVYNKLSDNNKNVENTYNFVKLNDTYAFTRNENWWSPELENQPKKSYEYESSGRCIKIKKDEFDLGKVIKTVKKEKKITPKITKKINKKSNIIRGERSFAMNWQGYDDLILGKIVFTEQDLFGKIKFSLPGNDGNCVGTYVLSQKKGTWSFICLKKDMNASGILIFNDIDGSIKGNGKDDKEKKIKFEISAKD